MNDRPINTRMTPAAHPSPINKWSQWLAKSPDLATLNEFVHEIGELEAADKQPVWNMVHHYATTKGWKFYRDKKSFA